MTNENKHAEMLSVNVNDHIEKKGNLNYLSWCWAWAEAIRRDASATFEVKMFGDLPYCTIGQTCMVWVTVTMFGKPLMCQLPVMDNRNKAIANPDAFAVNTAIMRCLAKAVALHGLGLYIYAGEDLPNVADDPVISREQEVNIVALAKEVGVDTARIVEKTGVSRLADIPASAYSAIIKKLEASRK